MTSSLPGNLAATLDDLGYAGSDGLVTKATEPSAELSETTSRSYLWRDLEQRVHLDAAFFHDGVPLVGFSDSTSGDGILELRKRLWNYGRVPILIVATDKGPEAYNGIDNPVSPDEGQLTLKYERQQLTASELVSAFSMRNVEAGNFTAVFEESYRKANRVDRGLLTNLRFLRRTYGGSSHERRSGLDALIGACITASYLAHRNVLDEEHMEQLCGVNTLEEALAQGRERTTALFAGLADRFNGDVFGSVERAISILDDDAFRAVSSLLRGDHLPTSQGALWPYDFSVLPPDLVTSVYEQLLEDRQQQDAAFYTPRSIVDLILDEIIPWRDEHVPTLIDLACGSGAFLTEAFRRFAFKARLRKGSQLTYSELRELLTSHVFGVDRNPDAARVAAFGTYLALLEEVHPPSIWATVSLPPLVGTNIVVSDAFDDHALRDRKYDAVVSNPPWRQELSSSAKRFVSDKKRPIAYNQIAQAFVWLADEVLKPGGRLGLVLPAKSVLHNRSDVAQRFRAELFQRLDVRSIVDLSPVRRMLFAGAISPPALLVADKPSGAHREGQDLGDSGEIIHITVHPRKFSQVSGTLVIAPEDLNIVTFAQAKFRADIWKTLVWGAQRDLDLLDRVRAKFPTLGDLVDARGWSTGQGFKDAPNQEQKDASFLAGFPIIDYHSILPLTRPRYLPDRFNRLTLHRPRTPDQYQAPQVLTRRTLPNGRLASTLMEESAAYSSELLSISGPKEDIDYLRMVAATISSAFGNYWQFMTSASWGVERGTVENNELLAMPVPSLSFDKYDMPTQARVRLLSRPRAVFPDKIRTDIDNLVFDLFQFGSTERLRIQEGLNNDLARFDAGPDYRMYASDDLLDRYTQTLRGSLSQSIVDVTVRCGFTKQDGYICVWASFEDETMSSALKNSLQIERIVDIETILRSGANASTGTIGMVSLPAAFLIDENTVYLVKTEDRDRWSYDAALNDADRIFTALAFGV
jgi:hypothetical protein